MYTGGHTHSYTTPTHHVGSVGGLSSLCVYGTHGVANDSMMIGNDLHAAEHTTLGAHT